MRPQPIMPTLRGWVAKAPIVPAKVPSLQGLFFRNTPPKNSYTSPVKKHPDELIKFKMNSGSLKGRVIQVPLHGPQARPTLSRVRQAMINILRPDLPGAIFLDLFAGTGLMGLHALSEGADTWWAEQDTTLSKALKSNLTLLGQNPQKVIVSSYERAIYQLGKQGISPDFVYLDPPFEMDPLPILLALAPILHPKTRIFLESNKELAQIPEIYLLHRSRQWGKIQIHELRLCDINP